MCDPGCKCDHPEVSKDHPEKCTLNQIIKCHGDEPFREILKSLLEEK